MKKTILLISILLFKTLAHAQGVVEDRLFSNFSVLNQIQIEANFAEMFLNKDTGQGREKWYDGQVHLGSKTIPTQIRMRGYSSMYICPFPKLMLKFKSQDTRGTVLEGVKKLDLATHCYPDSFQGERKFFVEMKYAHREALLYRWLQILGIPAYKARPAKVTYIDRSTTNALPTETHQAFFIQHLSEFMKENGLTREIKPVADQFRADWEKRNPEKVGTDEAPLYVFESPEKHEQLDRARLAEVALFEAIIGNNDWRMNEKELWNVKILMGADQSWKPVPLDFNLSAPILARTPQLNIPQIRTIFFRQSWFDLATTGQRLALVEKMISKIPELTTSVEMLNAEDEVGYRIFLQTLEEASLFLNDLKTQLQTPQ